MADYYCTGQMSLFDIPAEEKNPGEWVTEYGTEMTFDDIRNSIGQLIVIDLSTQSHEWYKVVRVEDIVCNRLVYYDGQNQRGIISEVYFKPMYTGYRPARAFRLR